ncbi:MAG TPA: NBR1-Ig-like domain-containing protein, partial [Anaerolineales bacterium]|nr:NBR1-Ig-like domain-containing protein [Anaerolineales bacterium]
PLPNTPTAIPPSSCDKVQFVADVNFPDGTVLQPGAQFTKTWRLKNVGTCAWTTSYELVFSSGEKMGAASSAKFPKAVAIGETVDISINMTAPTSAGSYRGYWMFKNADGAHFGIGSQANKPWWVDIKVTAGPTVTPGTPSATATQGGPTVTPSVTPLPQTGTAYDFAANACDASWHSGAGPDALPCPGTDGNAGGFVLKVSSPKLEDGTTDSRSGIITFPQNVQDGYIQGIYPAFKVQNGDRFQSTINCEKDANSCYVVFRLDYQTGSDPIKTFWGPFLERYEGGVFNVDVDLSPLADKDVKFILTVLAVGSPTGDRALWVGPRIYRPGSGSALPDLAVSQMKIELQNTSCLAPDDAVGTRIWVTNNGDGSAPSFDVMVGDVKQTVNGLAAGESKEVFFTGYSNPVSVVVDPDGLISESNEENNSRSEMLPVPTPPLPCSATSTPIPTTGWEKYFSEKYSFEFKYPKETTISNQSDIHARMSFPVAAGTNLSEKYLDLSVLEGAATCKSPDISGQPSTTETVTINNIPFVKETGSGAAAGSLYEFVAYSTASSSKCVSLTFVLHSTNPGNSETPPPEFDKAAESAIFDSIIDTFDWTG